MILVHCRISSAITSLDLKLTPAIRVSNCAAVCSFRRSTEKKFFHYGLILVFCILYLVFIGLFGVLLRSWDWDKSGRCYNITLFWGHYMYNALWITLPTIYFFLLLGFATLSIQQPKSRLQYVTLIMSSIQSPVHMYFIFVLRVVNERLLASGSTEQQWGFGQVTAIVLLGTNLVTLANGVQGVFTLSPF